MRIPALFLLVFNSIIWAQTAADQAKLPRAAPSISLWGFDHDVHAVEEQRGKVIALAMYRESDFGELQARQLNALADHYRDQGLVVWVWMVSGDDDGREVTQRIARFGEDSRFMLAVITVSQFRDFFGWNAPNGLQPSLPSLAQIDRTGQIRRLNALVGDEIDRHLDLSLLTKQVTNAKGAPPSIDPAAADFYRKLAGARESSAADWISKVHAVDVAVSYSGGKPEMDESSLKLAAQKAVLEQGMLVDTTSRALLSVAVKVRNYEHIETETLSRRGVDISSSSEKTPIAVLQITASFLTSGIVLRGGAFQHLMIAPYRTSSVSIAGSFSPGDVQQEINDIVGKAIQYARGDNVRPRSDDSWGAFIGDPSHAEDLFASYRKAGQAAFAVAAQVAKATQFRTISAVSTSTASAYPSEQPMGTADLREVLQKTRQYDANGNHFMGMAASIEIRQPRCLLEDAGGFSYLEGAIYTDEEANFELVPDGFTNVDFGDLAKKLGSRLNKLRGSQ